MNRSASLTSIIVALTMCACDHTDPAEPVVTDGGVGGDAGPASDAGPDVPTTVSCDYPTPAGAPGSCRVVPGSDTLLFVGDFVGPDGLYENGQVIVSGSEILCAGCDCATRPEAAGATRVECHEALISPGLINSHDHLTFTEAPPHPHPDEVYEHRHDWRRGKNGHTRIPSPRNSGGAKGVLWGELRQILGGATSINGSGGAPGFLRNIDQRGDNQEGLDEPPVEYNTFPLGDSSGATRVSGCDYPNVVDPSRPDIANASAFTPHVAEGIGLDARNEFLCLSSDDSGGADALSDRTSVIHGIGLTAADFAHMAAEGASLIWSPRSNIDLYGHTALVTMATTLGVSIGLGTDWAVSGSMNMLRELQCADSLNRNNYGGHFSDRALVDMATRNNAVALGVEDRIGAIAAGFVADIAIFDARAHRRYRAILDATPTEVVAVFRGGELLYGDQTMVESLAPDLSGCETLSVCERSKRICAVADTGHTVADLREAIASNAYDLFFCDKPRNEPSCIPYRPGEFDGIRGPDDADGDGIADARDNCPNVFNAPRPMDGMFQSDADEDGDGDPCDPCPLDPGTDACTPPDAGDRDGDGIEDLIDNCPRKPNPTQADGDEDGTGDVCDRCPDFSNPNDSACASTVQQVKEAMIEGVVVVDGLAVTAVADNGYFAQRAPTGDSQPAPDYSGIFVFTGAGTKPNRGDRVKVEGQVGEYFGQIQLSNASFELIASDMPLPEPVRVSASEVGTGGARAEALEAVLVEIIDATVTDVMPEPGPGDRAPTHEFVIDGALRVNDLMYRITPTPQPGEALDFVRGILRWANQDHKIEPRDALDVGLDAELLGFEPGRVSVAVGRTELPEGGLAVVLTRPVLAVTPIALSSSDPAVLVPRQVEVMRGSDRADIILTATATTARPVLITAEYGDRTVTATVVPYSDQTERSIDYVALALTTVVPSSTVAGVVRLNLPAPAGGQRVSLAVVPGRLGSVSPEVVVPAEAREAAFVVRTSSTTGTAALVARTASVSEARFIFQISRSVTRAPIAGDLVITEIHRNPSGSDERQREWFEIYNRSEDTLILDGLLLWDNLGESAGHTVQTASIGPEMHGVFGYNADLGIGWQGRVLGAYGESNIQLSNSSDQINLSLNNEVLANVAWGSGFPGANGQTACLVAPYPEADEESEWAESFGAFGGDDLGHPGEVSTSTNCR